MGPSEENMRTGGPGTSQAKTRRVRCQKEKNPCDLFCFQLVVGSWGCTGRTAGTCTRYAQGPPGRDTPCGARGCDALALTLWDMARTFQQTLNVEDSLDRENQSMVMVMIEPLEFRL